MEQLPIQMLVLDLERELVFLDKLTQDLVLAVRYVRALNNKICFLKWLLESCYCVLTSLKVVLCKLS